MKTYESLVDADPGPWSKAVERDEVGAVAPTRPNARADHEQLSDLGWLRQRYVDLLVRDPRPAYAAACESVAKTEVVCAPSLQFGARLISFDDGSHVVVIDSGLINALGTYAQVTAALWDCLDRDGAPFSTRAERRGETWQMVVGRPLQDPPWLSSRGQALDRAEATLRPRESGRLLRFALSGCRFANAAIGGVNLQMNAAHQALVEAIIQRGLLFVLAHEFAHLLLETEGPHPLVRPDLPAGNASHQFDEPPCRRGGRRDHATQRTEFPGGFSSCARCSDDR